MSSADLIVTKAKEIIDKTMFLKDQIDEISEWNSYSKVVANIGLIVGLMECVVITVETVFHEIKKSLGDDATGETKLEAAATIIDQILKFPIWLELIDKYVIKIAISMVVHYINESQGHDWKLNVK